MVSTWAQQFSGHGKERKMCLTVSLSLVVWLTLRLLIINRLFSSAVAIFYYFNNMLFSQISISILFKAQYMTNVRKFCLCCPATTQHWIKSHALTSMCIFGNNIINNDLCFRKLILDVYNIKGEFNNKNIFCY